MAGSSWAVSAMSDIEEYVALLDKFGCFE